MNEMELSRQTPELDRPNPMQPIALRSMFWRPAWLEASAWQEHIPFAFWLIEAHRPKVVVELGTHHGTSYFAMCQAVDRLGLDTRCFAVDTWKGDEHTGDYDESVFEKVRAYNDAQYSGFSRLVRSTFDEALKHFTDGTVDLLHIDGLHTVEAVSLDFESWLPKLSDRAVVIFHDTNVRERGFGVYQIFERLKQQYPAFEFVHGHGLGVLGVGEHQSPMLDRLFDSNGQVEAQRSIHEVFSRLGRSCADAYAVQQQQATFSHLSNDIRLHKERWVEVNKVLSQTRRELETRTSELVGSREQYERQVERHALERGQLVERASMLQEVKTDLKEQISRLQSQVDTAREARSDPSFNAERFSALQTIHAAEIDRLKAKLEHILKQSAEDKERHELEKEQAVARLQAIQSEGVAARDNDSLLQADRDELLKAHTKAVDELNAQLDSERALNAELMEKHGHETEVLSEAKRRAEASVQIRFAETAQLTKQLIELQQELAASEAAAKNSSKQLEAVRSELEAVRRELEGARNELESTRNELEDARQLATRLRDELNAIESSRSWKITSMLRRSRGGAHRLPITSASPSELSHHSEEVRLVRESGLFDSDWYMKRYPDVGQAGIDAAEHYLLHGASELRDPGPAFSTARYLAEYPDVAEAGLNPLVHYMAFGRAEGRIAPQSE